MLKKIAIVGGGGGGLSASVDLTLRGYKVNLYEFPEFKKNIDNIVKYGGIYAKGQIQTFLGVEKLNKLTTDFKEAIEGVNVIQVMVRAMAHDRVVELLTQNIEDEQIVAFNGQPGCALLFAKKLKDAGINKDIIFGETNTLTYATLTYGEPNVVIVKKKGGVYAAAFPSKNNEKFLNAFKELYPVTLPAANVLETMLYDLNFDHIITIPNAAYMERTIGQFPIWAEGVTPSVARLMEAADKERLALLKALGLSQISHKENIYRQGFTAKIAESILDAFNEAAKAPGAREWTAPCGPDALTGAPWWLVEEVPYSLVFMASLGDVLGVPTPVLKSVVTLSSAMLGTNFWKEGRTLEKLGISKTWTVNELNKFVTEGEI